jgi:hypothetical protein
MTKELAAAIAAAREMPPASTSEHERLWAVHRETILAGWWKLASDGERDTVALIVSGDVTEHGRDFAAVVPRSKAFDCLQCIQEHARGYASVAALFGDLLVYERRVARPIVIVASGPDGMVDIDVRRYYLLSGTDVIDG